jgi:hypothetical protein
MKYKRLLQIALLIFSGWFSEFSFIVSWIQAIHDIVRSSYLSALPSISEFSWWYGLSWRVSFSVGAPVGLHVIGVALLFLILWIFYEFYKGEI